MDERNRQPIADPPPIYRITVRGRLDADWEGCFDGMILTTATDASGRATTTLMGRPADQAALHGLLRSLYNLGLPLLAVVCLE